jgi:hypothetical protein
LDVSKYENTHSDRPYSKERRGHSRVLDGRSYRQADYDKRHYLVVANIKGRIEGLQKLHVEGFYLKKMKEVEVKRTVVLRSQTEEP